jgi:hypothetical protein
MDLVSQHVGDLTGAVRARPPDRRRFGQRHADTVKAQHAACTMAKSASAQVS